MQITVWRVAADDDNGTYASVQETELAAYRRLIELTVDCDDKDQELAAGALKRRNVVYFCSGAYNKKPKTSHMNDFWTNIESRYGAVV